MNNNSEGIVVYCKRGNIIFSSNGDLIEAQQHVRKHKVNKNIINPEFEEMKKFCEEDEFWTSMLSKFSKNIFPKNFKYMNGIVYFKITAKKHRSECCIDKEEIEFSFKNLKEFFKIKGFLSNIEKQQNRDLIEEELEEERSIIDNWKSVYNKEYYVLEFMLFLKDKHELNKKEYNNLESTIKIGIGSDFFNSENIILENEKISEIENLVWDSEKRKFSINTENIKFKKKSEKKNTSKIFTSYTIETSGDNSEVFFREVNNIEIGKKFSKFLENLY